MISKTFKKTGDSIWTEKREVKPPADFMKALERFTVRAS